MTEICKLQELIGLELEAARTLLDASGTAYQVVVTSPPRGEIQGVRRVVRAVNTKSGVEITVAAFLPAKE